MQRWSTVVYDGKQRKGKLENWPMEFCIFSIPRYAFTKRSEILNLC